MLALLCLPVLSCVSVQTTVLVPDGDAYVCDCKPDSTNPNGGPTHLYFGRYGSCLDRTLISWDVSAIPAGAAVGSAVMRLYCFGFFGSPTGQPSFHLIDEDWDELTVTLNTQPEYGEDPSVTASWPAAGSWFEVDVTEFVQAWVDGSHPVEGIYCSSTGTTGTSVPGFWSKDSPDETLWPQLVVTWSEEGMECGTWAAIKSEN